VKSFLNKSADPIGTNVMDIPLASYILERYDSKIFNQNIAITNCELKYTDDNNARKVYRYNIYQLLNIKEEIYGVVLSFEDITQEVLFKEESFEKQKNKALNKIIAGIAHEIRNPLTSIKIAIDTKLFRHNDIQIQNQMSDLLSKEIDRVNCLINDLIDYAKPYVAQKERIEVQELVQFCIGLMLPGLRNKQVKVCVEVEQNLIIFEDRKQIEQVLINIILNASESIFEKIKLEPNNQHIYKLLITAQNCNNGYINIQVYDEGVGMNNDAIKQSTDLFYTTKTNGKGIGLSFCKQVIEDNGGKIIIRSELNKYAEVTIKLRSVAIGNYSLNKLYKSY
jgi:polar amino acid transport system substrate-binding protein